MRRDVVGVQRVERGAGELLRLWNVALELSRRGIEEQVARALAFSRETSQRVREAAQREHA